MKSYLLRLDDEDNRIRTALLKRYEKKHGRPISFAEIVRTMMRKEFNLSEEQNTYWYASDSHE